MKKLLKLLKVGWLVVAIALSGASLGVATSTNTKNTEFVTKQSTISDEINNDNSSVMKNQGILGLHGGFKSTKNIYGALQLDIMMQTILDIPIGASFSVQNMNEIKVESEKKEVEIIDLSKTMGNLEWILNQLKYPNKYTSKISMETLHKIEYTQRIIFRIKQKNKVQFDNKQWGIFGVVVDTHHEAGITKQTNTPAKAESWSFVFNLKKESNKFHSTAGTLATSMPKIPNSEVFKTTLNEEAILDANLQILLWKKSGSAKPDGTDFDIAIMLNKKTGKAFIWAKTRIVISVRGVDGIAPPSITL